MADYQNNPQDRPDENSYPSEQTADRPAQTLLPDDQPILIPLANGNADHLLNGDADEADDLGMVETVSDLSDSGDESLEDSDATTPGLSSVPNFGQMQDDETADPTADDTIPGASASDGVVGNTRPLSSHDLVNAGVTGSLDNLLDTATRPLQPDSPLLRPNTDHGIFALSTHKGMKRENNEDAGFAFYASGRLSEEIPDFGLFIVADGMGGHKDGEKASAYSSRAVASEIMTSLYLPLLHQNPNQDPIVEVLADAVQLANAEIVQRIPDGGTTFTAVVVMHDRAYIAHVGDSRAYLIQKNGIEQLTRDHSVVQRLIELDHMTPDEARNYPNPNMLYRALGQNDVVDVDTLTRRLPTNARLLLCSDGLWGQVADEEIMDVVLRAPHPQEACHQLIALANARGGIDNVTVILLQLPR